MQPTSPRLSQHTVDSGKLTVDSGKLTGENGKATPIDAEEEVGAVLENAQQVATVEDVQENQSESEASIATTEQPTEIPVEPWRLCRPPNEGERDRLMKYARVFQKVISYSFSHVGLTVLVIGYTIMGGFLFKFLEGKTEIVERTTISKKRNATIWLMTADLNVLEQANWSRAVERIMKDFQDDVVIAIKERGWDGRDEFNKDISWSFFGSVLYSVTVLTTIGYGHIAPKTQWGRMTTMLYALLGIPLTLLCLSTIGESWAKCFRFLYKYVSLVLAKVSRCRGPPIELRRKTIFKEALHTKGVTVPLWVSLLIIGGYIGGGAVLFSTWQQDWDYLVAAYFCFITLSTIGFGDFVFGFGSDNNSNVKLIASSMYLFMGLAIIAMCFNLMQEEVRERFKRIGLRLGLIKPVASKSRRMTTTLAPVNVSM
ncbi:unnamed protein product [Candidula unifasciata]|uniref:Potassium channel domain-containing protein n=1 Tax=Candidula unifasciata TaxID=100452 RepID=A0A8S3Z2K5_9EUPU|nr:unnamed protein product [Candidula unifasciata]